LKGPAPPHRGAGLLFCPNDQQALAAPRSTAQDKPPAVTA